MASTTNVIIRLQLQGATTFAAGASAAAGSVQQIGVAAQTSSTQTSRLRSAMGKLAGPLKVAGGALAAAGTAAAVMGVKYNASMEQTRVAFKQFLGSGKAADKMLTDLQALNKATPFEFPELAGTTKKLLAMGFTAKDAMAQTRTLADAVAGIGGGGAELDRAALALGQISSKGKLTAEDLMQLTELGMVGMKDLAKQFNMSGGEFAKAMSQGKISSDEALTAINKVASTNFGGAAAKQSQTFSGQLSNLKDSASQLMGEAMVPLFDFLRTEGLPALQEAMPTIKELATTFGTALVDAINAAVAVAKVFVENWNTIKAVLLVVGPILLGVITYLTIMKVVTIAAALPTNILAAAWAAFNAIMALNPIVLAVAALVALIAIMVIAYKKFDWFKAAVDAVWGALKTAFNWVKTNWPLLLAILTGPFGLAIYMIRKHWDTIKRVIASLPDKVKDVLNKAKNAITSGASAVFNAAKELGRKLLRGIADGIKAAAGIVRSALGWVIDKLPVPGILKNKLKDVLGFAAGGVMPRTGLAVVGERGPELLQLPGGSRITPLPPPAPALAGAASGGGGRFVAEIYLDRRMIATAVAEDTADRKARR